MRNCFMPSPALLSACTELFRKSGHPGYTGNEHFECIQGCLHMQKHLWLLVPAQEPLHWENAVPAQGAFAGKLLRLSEGACGHVGR